MNPKPPQTLTTEESEKLLTTLSFESGTNIPKPHGLRNFTMALLMLDAGLRVGELVRLLQTDLIVNGEPVTSLCVSREIARKKAERIIPLSQRLRTALSDMQNTWWFHISVALTPCAFYRTNHQRPLSTRQVERIIKRAALEAIGRPIHPHILRHTFASRLMRISSTRIVQQLLGHKCLSSTQIYTHPNQQDLTNAINNMSQPVIKAVSKGIANQIKEGADAARLTNKSEPGISHGT